jgi:hypothetical protein
MSVALNHLAVNLRNPRHMRISMNNRKVSDPIIA